MVYLSPWPDPDTEAVSLLAQTLGHFSVAVAGSTEDRARVAALGKASAALVERYAAGAPQEIKDEAVVRSAGWLNQIPTGIISEEITEPARVFDTSTTLPRTKKLRYASSAGALRSSGAMALLSPFKIRRAGVLK